MPQVWMEYVNPATMISNARDKPEPAWRRHNLTCGPVQLWQLMDGVPELQSLRTHAVLRMNKFSAKKSGRLRL